MRKTVPARRVLGAAIVAVLALSTVGFEAYAQSARDPSGGRRARQAAAASAPAEAAYPAVTRKEPAQKASSKLTPKLQKMFDAYEKDDVATVQPLADEIIADEKATPYDRAIAARVIGSMLIGEDDARAQAYLNQAVEANGLSNNEHYESMLVLAQLQLQDEKFNEALTTLDRFLSETGSQKPEHLVLKGNALYRLERYPEAVAVLKPAIEGATEPRAEWTQLLMAAYSDSGQSGEAARLAERIASSAPGDKRAQMNLAATYMQSDQLDKALAVYEQLRASGQLDEDRDYRNMYALYLNADGKERQAIEVINDGIAKGVLKPDHQAYVALAQAYYFSDQPGLAIEAYEKAAPLAPDGETYLNLAKALANEGRAAESKAAAQKALDKGVKNAADAQKLIAR